MSDLSEEIRDAADALLRATERRQEAANDSYGFFGQRKLDNAHALETNARRHLAALLFKQQSPATEKRIWDEYHEVVKAATLNRNAALTALEKETQHNEL